MSSVFAGEVDFDLGDLFKMALFEAPSFLETGRMAQNNRGHHITDPNNAFLRPLFETHLCFNHLCWYTGRFCPEILKSIGTRHYDWSTNQPPLTYPPPPQK